MYLILGLVDQQCKTDLQSRLSDRVGHSVRIPCSPVLHCETEDSGMLDNSAQNITHKIVCAVHTVHMACSTYSFYVGDNTSPNTLQLLTSLY